MATPTKKRKRPANPNLKLDSLTQNLAAEAGTAGTEGHTEVAEPDLGRVNATVTTLDDAVVQSAATAEPAQDGRSSEQVRPERNRGGRPKKDTERLVVYLQPDVYDAVRRFGFENRRTYSNVINALAAQFLSQLDPETVDKK